MINCLQTTKAKHMHSTIVVLQKKNKGKYYPINKRGVLKMFKICGKYLILYACIAQNCWTSALCAKTNEQWVQHVWQTN